MLFNIFLDMIMKIENVKNEKRRRSEELLLLFLLEKYG